MSERGKIMRLADYDIILINSSAGKDSQAMLDYVYSLAVTEDVADRITVLSLAQVQQEIAAGAQGGAGEWGQAL